jgi:hypothetical protein
MLVMFKAQPELLFHTKPPKNKCRSTVTVGSKPLKMKCSVCITKYRTCDGRPGVKCAYCTRWKRRCSFAGERPVTGLYARNHADSIATRQLGDDGLFIH